MANEEQHPLQLGNSDVPAQEESLSPAQQPQGGSASTSPDKHLDEGSDSDDDLTKSGDEDETSGTPVVLAPAVNAALVKQVGACVHASACSRSQSHFPWDGPACPACA